jgi:hypothetical protein
MLTYTLTQEQLQLILNYLATKPYAEVFKLVETVRSIKPNVESVDVTPPLIAQDAQEKTA